MKNLTKLLFALVAAALLQAATHTVTLNWQDTQNPAGATYNVYRATGLCSGSPAFSKVASSVAALTYVDASVTPGNYCYYVTAVVTGIESGPSNSALAPVPSFAPTSVTLQIQ